MAAVRAKTTTTSSIHRPTISVDMQKLDKIKNVKFQSFSPCFLAVPSALSRGRNIDSGARNANTLRRTRRRRPAIRRRDLVDVVVTPDNRLHPEAFASAPSPSPLFSHSRSASSRCARQRALSFASLPSALRASDESDSGRINKAKSTKVLFKVAAT